MKATQKGKTCSVSSCTASAFSRGWCKKHQQRWAKYGDPEYVAHVTNDMTLDERLRFYGWTVTESGCWEWNASRTKPGYGRLAYKGRTISTHRAAYEAWVGPIPEGLVVRHFFCDNPPCVNPDHLRLGTHKDNAADKVSKGRAVGNPAPWNSKKRLETT